MLLEFKKMNFERTFSLQFGPVVWTGIAKKINIQIYMLSNPYYL